METALKRIARYESRGDGALPEPTRELSRLEQRFVDLVAEYDGRKSMVEIARMAGYSEKSAGHSVSKLPTRTARRTSWRPSGSGRQRSPPRSR